MQELLWLLLPLAALSGWYAAMGSARKRAGAPRTPVSPDYLRGVNYLLDQQPDKAIELFTKALEVDSETVETHLALGNLFRRRGEVDRAIRIHQNLISRENLAPAERSDAVLELGHDYLRAGLLDRAEALFLELVDSDRHAERALRKLVDIYEQERDWERAIRTARRLERCTGKPLARVIAHYHCEQAEERNGEGRRVEGLATVRRALDVSAICVRASLLEGRLLSEKGQYRAAMLAYKRVEQQDPDYLAEIIGPLVDCCIREERVPEMIKYLSYLMERYGGITVTLALADMKAREKSEAEAIGFLTQQLRRRPSVRGLHRLIELSTAHVEGPAEDYMMLLGDLADKLLADRPVYACRQCGFAGKVLHWQCPSCKDWGTVKPIQGVQGE
ncbi:MAG: lipopolysaccharide assembly protein LapB [Gammaproteobacteria bacterium]|nr:lipopolysaccharide assembly protein LapB [Gammaproteobacteria bacterium]